MLLLISCLHVSSLIGRGGNRWLAPIGCAMYSLHVRIPMKTHLADKLPFLQHIASAAVVEAIRSLKGYEVRVRGDILFTP